MGEGKNIDADPEGIRIDHTHIITMITLLYFEEEIQNPKPRLSVGAFAAIGGASPSPTISNTGSISHLLIIHTRAQCPKSAAKTIFPEIAHTISNANMGVDFITSKKMVRRHPLWYEIPYLGAKFRI